MVTIVKYNKFWLEGHFGIGLCLPIQILPKWSKDSIQSLESYLFPNLQRNLA